MTEFEIVKGWVNEAYQAGFEEGAKSAKRSCNEGAESKMHTPENPSESWMQRDDQMFLKGLEAGYKKALDLVPKEFQDWAKRNSGCEEPTKASGNIDEELRHESATLKHISDLQDAIADVEESAQESLENRYGVLSRGLDFLARRINDIEEKLEAKPVSLENFKAIKADLEKALSVAAKKYEEIKAKVEEANEKVSSLRGSVESKVSRKSVLKKYRSQDALFTHMAERLSKLEKNQKPTIINNPSRR